MTDSDDSGAEITGMVGVASTARDETPASDLSVLYLYVIYTSSY